jgi:hypothetical protein
MDMPCTVHAFTLKEDVDSFDVYINARLCREAQVEAYEHEIAHIENGDFERE